MQKKFRKTLTLWQKSNIVQKMKNFLKLSRIRRLIGTVFETGVLIKSFIGVFELLGGVLFAFSGDLVANNFIIYMAQQEVAEDPNDFIATHVISAANDLQPNANIFPVIYLISHGIINILLSMALFRNKMWAFPLAIFGFGFFIVYQIYRYLHTYSLALLALTLFDIFLLVFVWLQYKNRTARVK